MAQKPTPGSPTATGKTPPTFGFGSLFVAKVLFQELPKLKLEDGETLSPMSSSITLGYGLNDSGNQGEVRFTLTVEPDPREKPYRIEVEVVGTFVLKTGDKEHLDEFCRKVAPTVLFPYIREVVHRTTMDARFGAIRLDPVNIQGVIKEDQWVKPPSPSPTAK